MGHGEGWHGVGDMDEAWQGMVGHGEGWLGVGDETEARRAVGEEGEGRWAMENCAPAPILPIYPT